ncbi:helix-turn-helix transcriptional regulator [Listeria booriae]|uniref:Helix-turn-helix transcriptional regulator n=1 Tax=Listeria booriae TaxID=1552123 RepID=A0A842D6L2_9LIST|nr:helix-turn-helix transcriptional regulator [Listeria booriae]MBC2005517.1 helix-turn-helix transcriptional regulator [Listeria booriae]
MDELISQWIKDTRKSSYYSQEDFAKKVLGKSKRHMIRLENMEAKLSLVEFLQIIIYFDLDAHPTLSNLLEKEDSMSQIKTLFSLAKDPTYDSELLLSKIELLENATISSYNQSRLELMRSFINFKDTQDEKFLKYFIDHIENDSIDGIRLLNCSLYLLSNAQIVKCIESLRRNDFQKKAEILNKLLINALGVLIDRKYKDYEYIDQLFLKTKEFTLQNREYIYLPILFFHMAVFNKNIANKKDYKYYKEKAILLAEVYENKEMLNNINKEI